MTKPRISVLVPVKDVSLSAFKECINSIKAQSFRDWNCLIYNDGSTHEDLLKFFEELEQDKRFKVIHCNINRGVSHARNVLIDSCEAEYGFLFDSDDVMTCNCLASALQFAEYNKLDVSALRLVENCQNTLQPPSPFIEQFSNQELDVFFRYAWRIMKCLFKVEAIRRENVYFDTSLSVGEDSLWVYDLLFNKKIKIALNDNIGHIYRYNWYLGHNYWHTLFTKHGGYDIVSINLSDAYRKVVTRILGHDPGLLTNYDYLFTRDSNRVLQHIPPKERFKLLKIKKLRTPTCLRSVF